MRKLAKRIIATFLTVAWTSVPALAHDFWIEPSQFLLPEPGPVGIVLREGVDLKGNSIRYIPAWIDDFSQTDVAGKTTIASQMGSDPAAIIDLTRGTTLIGYQSNRFFVELGPEKFDSYIREEAMDFVLDQRRERGEAELPAKEYFVRCAKSLVQAGMPGDESHYADELGYTLEIIPEQNPYRLDVGDEFSVRLLYLGQPMVNTRVRAFTEESLENPIDQWTDAEGRATFMLPDSGEWFFKAVHLVPVENDDKANWESFWASLTFRLD